MIAPAANSVIAVPRSGCFSTRTAGMTTISDGTIRWTRRGALSDGSVLK